MKNDYCGNTFRNAARRWDNEVDAEAARLVEEGIPPFEAMRRATEIVSQRRKHKGKTVK